MKGKKIDDGVDRNGPSAPMASKVPPKMKRSQEEPHLHSLPKEAVAEINKCKKIGQDWSGETKRGN